MLCCEPRCICTAVYLERCVTHVISFRRNYPGVARRHDEAVARAEHAASNAYGKALLTQHKEAHHGQGQDT